MTKKSKYSRNEVLQAYLPSFARVEAAQKAVLAAVAAVALLVEDIEQLEEFVEREFSDSAKK